MVAQRFQETARNEASGTASVGHGKPAPLTRGALQGAGEQQMLATLYAYLGHAYSRALIASYYVALKSDPLVVLTGPEGIGKNALVEGFANSLLGLQSGQFVTIGSSSWVKRTSQPSYYRWIHERYGSLSFLETLQEAAAGGNQGRLYLVFLKGLHPDEVSSFLNHLVSIDANGQRRLALPSVAAEAQPILPPNVLITATLHAKHDLITAHSGLGAAGLIEVDGMHGQLPPLPLRSPPPPVGFQRLPLRCRVQSAHEAFQRLQAILSPSELSELGLTELRESHDRNTRQRHLIVVANSFDQANMGLIAPNNPFHNARLALSLRR